MECCEINLSAAESENKREAEGSGEARGFRTQPALVQANCKTLSRGGCVFSRPEGIHSKVALLEKIMVMYFSRLWSQEGVIHQTLAFLSSFFPYSLSNCGTERKSGFKNIPIIYTKHIYFCKRISI